MFDPQKIRRDFPIFSAHKNLIYLDSAATSLKPQQVIDKENEYYEKYSANIYRGIYRISERATGEYENVREKVAHFIGAQNKNEVVFTRNTTEAINLVMYGLSRTPLHGREIATTIMEHHSNFVPWQQLALGFKIPLKIWNVNNEGRLDIEELKKVVSRKTKLLALTTVSNVLGTINPVKEIVARVKKINPKCLVLIDAAQAVPHMRVNVGDWNADFVAFSSHKMLGPTGVGVLWGKMQELQKLSPYQYGGEMIQAVYRDKTVFKDPPHKFEAGTPNIAGVIGFGAAIDYLEKLGFENIRKHETELTKYALQQLNNVDNLTIYGPNKAESRGGVTSFTIKTVHSHDIAQILDSDNICVRSGHHCAMPLHNELGVVSTARASFYIYNTKSDLDALVHGLTKVQKVFN